MSAGWELEWFGNKFCSVATFALLFSTTFSPIDMQGNRGAQGGTGCLLFICKYLLVVWILFSQEGKGNFFKEKRESFCLDTWVWTWVAGWFPDQSACGFHSPWHAISSQSTSPNPPDHVPLSQLSFNLNTMEFSDKHEQRLFPILS